MDSKCFEGLLDLISANLEGIPAVTFPLRASYECSSLSRKELSSYEGSRVWQQSLHLILRIKLGGLASTQAAPNCLAEVHSTDFNSYLNGPRIGPHGNLR